jgi:hypothetical protein
VVVGDWGPEVATTARPRPRGPPPPLAAAPPLSLPPLLRAPLDLCRRSSGEEEEAQAAVRLPPLPRPTTRRRRRRRREGDRGRGCRRRRRERDRGRGWKVNVPPRPCRPPRRRWRPSTATSTTTEKGRWTEQEVGGLCSRLQTRPATEQDCRRRSRLCGTRSDWEGERPRFPENAVPWGGHHKMQQVLCLLLEELQCALRLHFADARLDPAATGDSLSHL